MTVVTQFPCAVREVENSWIPLSDGVRLATRMWLPEDADVLRDRLRRLGYLKEE